MRLVICGINYRPELTGIGKYSGEMAEWLVAKGHEVHVVTAPPYYPQWRVSDDYRSWLYRCEYLNGVKVWRCPLWIPSRPSGLKRILHLASFSISSFPVMLSQVFWRPNIIMVIEPPLFCAPTGLIVSWLCRSRSWLHIQDFEVDAALDLGLLRIVSLRGWVRSLEAWIMRRFDRVSTISNRMVERSTGKGVRAASTILFPNWVDTNLIHPLEGSNSYRKEQKISDEMVVALYSGNMGNKQGLEVLADVAKSLQHEQGLCFVYCGNGSGRNALMQACEGLRNVYFMDLQPLSRLNELLNLADIHLLPQRADAADLVMPSKLTGMLASGKAVIATVPEGTEVAKVVRKCGLVVSPEQPDELSKAILKLAREPKLRAALGQEGRQLAKRTMSKDVVLNRFLENIQRCVDKTDNPVNQGYDKS